MVVLKPVSRFLLIQRVGIFPMIGPVRRAEGIWPGFFGNRWVFCLPRSKIGHTFAVQPVFGLVCLLVPILLWLSRDLHIFSGFQVLLVGEL